MEDNVIYGTIGAVAIQSVAEDLVCGEEGHYPAGNYIFKGLAKDRHDMYWSVIFSFVLFPFM